MSTRIKRDGVMVTYRGQAHWFPWLGHGTPSEAFARECELAVAREQAEREADALGSSKANFDDIPAPEAAEQSGFDW